MEKNISLNCNEEQFQWLQEKDPEEMEELQTLIKKYLESLGMPSSENKKTKKIKLKKHIKLKNLIKEHKKC